MSGTDRRSPRLVDNPRKRKYADSNRNEILVEGTISYNLKAGRRQCHLHPNFKLEYFGPINNPRVFSFVESLTIVPGDIPHAQLCDLPPRANEVITALIESLSFDVVKKQWRVTEPNQDLNDDERDQFDEVATAFCRDFEDARGRMGMTALMKILLRDRLRTLKVSNVGGGAVGREPTVSHIRFKVNFDFIGSVSSDSTSHESGSLPPSGEDSPETKKDSPSVDEYEKNFVPDVVVETRKEMSPRMIISCKTGPISPEDTLQLIYRMMPILLEQGLASGFIIHQKHAIMVQLSVNDSIIYYHARRYDFLANFSKTFMQLCYDCRYYCSHGRAHPLHNDSDDS